MKTCEHGAASWLDCELCKSTSTMVRVRPRGWAGATPLYHPTVDDLPRADEVDARNKEGGK
jgi:hypothetical protein